MGTILVILLIAAVGGGVFLFIKKSKKSKPESKSQPKKPANWDTIKPTTSPKKDSEPKGFDTSSLHN